MFLYLVCFFFRACLLTCRIQLALQNTLGTAHFRNLCLSPSLALSFVLPFLSISSTSVYYCSSYYIPSSHLPPFIHASFQHKPSAYHFSGTENTMINRTNTALFSMQENMSRKLLTLERTNTVLVLNISITFTNLVK